jgi:uncharacterized Zn finger protein (UPF0148 family)
VFQYFTNYGIIVCPLAETAEKLKLEAEYNEKKVKQILERDNSNETRL